MSEHPDAALLHRHGRVNLLKIALDILNAADVRTRTSSPGWKYIIKNTGLGKTSVHKWIKWLRERGLLGLVACGRQATHLPKGSKQTTADQAVYVLCEPLVEAEDKRRTIPVPVGELSPPRTREHAGSQSKTQEGGATPRQKDILPAFGAPLRSQPTRRLAPWTGTRRVTPAGTRVERRRERLQAAVWLQSRLALALRGATVPQIAHAIRPYLDAGWHCNDLAAVLDRMPDGRLWPHDGFRGAKHPERILARRLKAWTRAGEPLLSPAQRLRAAQAHARYLARVEAERIEAERKAIRANSTDYALRAISLRMFVRELPTPAFLSR